MNVLAEIKMSYICIEKEKEQTKTVKELVLEIIDKVTDSRDNKSIKVNEFKGLDIHYRIVQKKELNRCYFEIISSARVNKAVSSLKIIDNALFKSPLQRHFHCIKNYDGISESFCKRLYPKYAEFERKLRSIVLLILTEAYGSEWKNETVSEQLLSEIKETAKGNVTLSTLLENMDLSTLEGYLFDKREVDYIKILDEKFSAESLKKLQKEEICQIIEQMRPTSLWERHFEKFGSVDSWKRKIEEIHDIRNKVAHQKTISEEEFIQINKKMNSINRELSSAIIGIQEDNFTELGMIDVLGSFAILASKMANVVESQAFFDVITSFNNKIQELVKPIVQICHSEGITQFANLLKPYADINSEKITGGMIAGLNTLSQRLPNTKEIGNNLIGFQKLARQLEAVEMAQAVNNILPNVNITEKAD